MATTFNWSNSRGCGSQPQISNKVNTSPKFKDSSKVQRWPSSKAHVWLQKHNWEAHYLEKSSSCPDIAYAVHQCTRFCQHPKEEHIKAIIHLARYLQATKDQGIVLSPKEGKSFEFWVDANFTGNWNKQTATNDASTAKSHLGYILTYGDCPIYWTSKLQMQIVLSSFKAEYISLSQSLRV